MQRITTDVNNGEYVDYARSDLNCQMKSNSVLGSGMSASVYKYGDLWVKPLNMYHSGQEYVDEIYKLSLRKNLTDREKDKLYGHEYVSLRTVYEALKNRMPLHVMRPLKMFFCRGSDMFGITSIKRKANIDEIPSYRVIVGDNVGDESLYRILKKISRREQIEIVFQLISFLILMHKYAKVAHGDLHMDNIITKNTREITVRLSDKRFTLTPSYIAFPIDYGNSGKIENDDYRYDYLTIYQIAGDIPQVFPDFTTYPSGDEVLHNTFAIPTVATLTKPPFTEVLTVENVN